MKIYLFCNITDLREKTPCGSGPFETPAAYLKHAREKHRTALDEVLWHASLDFTVSNTIQKSLGPDAA